MHICILHYCPLLLQGQWLRGRAACERDRPCVRCPCAHAGMDEWAVWLIDTGMHAQTESIMQIHLACSWDSMTQSHLSPYKRPEARYTKQSTSIGRRLKAV